MFYCYYYYYYLFWSSCTISTPVLFNRMNVFLLHVCLYFNINSTKRFVSFFCQHCVLNIYSWYYMDIQLMLYNITWYSIIILHYIYLFILLWWMSRLLPTLFKFPQTLHKYFYFPIYFNHLLFLYFLILLTWWT